MFLAFDVHVRHLSCNSARLITQRKNWPRMQRNLSAMTPSDLYEAAESLKQGRKPRNKKVWSVINNIEAIGQNVPLSDQQRQKMRRDAFGMIIWNAEPGIWLTINLNDLGNPLCCKVAGVNIPLNASARMRRIIRKVAATKDPVSAARFFKLVVDAFFKHVVRIDSESGGIFGPCDSYFATTEASGRGALHLHCLVWLTGNTGFGNLRERIATDEKFVLSVNCIDYLHTIYNNIKYSYINSY